MASPLFHVGISVDHLDDAINFFVDGLGLVLRHRQVQDNAYSRSLVGEPEARFRIAQLTYPGQDQPRSGHLIELIEYDHPRLAPLELRNPQPGAMHIAFLVDDVDATAARLQRLGATLTSQPVAITQGINAGGSAVYLRGPGGATIELISVPS